MQKNKLQTLMIGGKVVKFSDEMGYRFIDENNSTQVSFRITLETFGAMVDWDR